MGTKRGRTALEKVSLTGAKETLLITLYAKALESRMPASLLRDRFAADAAARIDYDFARLRVRHDDIVGLAIRAHALDVWTRDFLSRHPGATVLHLGCGLDSRVFRVDPPPEVAWFDVDYPEVVALRRRLYPPRPGCTLVGASVTDPHWLGEIPADRPAMILAEGLFPYLPAREVPRLLRRLTAHLPRGELAFDGYSRLGVRLLRAYPPIRATGAKLDWAIDDPRELEDAVPRLRLIEERSVYDPAETGRMSWPARATIALFAVLPGLRRVARLLRYQF